MGDVTSGATIEYRWGMSAGAVVHAVPDGRGAAVCGAEPARGWSPGRASAPTCGACRRKLGMGTPDPRAGGGAG